MPENKKIAIIGGGIAGLSCLHFLAKYGIAADLFEAENRLGGRVYTYKKSNHPVELGAYVFHREYHTLLEVIADMNLTEAIQTKNLGKAGFLKNHQLIGLDFKSILLALITKKLNLVELKSIFTLLSSASKNYRYFFNFLKEYGESDQATDALSFAKKNPTIATMYQRKFIDTNTNYPPEIFDNFVSPISRKLLFQNPAELNFMLGNAIFGAKTFPLKTLKGGLATLIDKLQQTYQNNIQLAKKISQVTFEKEKFNLIIDNTKFEYDTVVFATPLAISTQLFPQKTCPVHYAKGTVSIINGSLKKPFNQCDALLINDHSGVINGITKFHPNIYAVYSMGTPTENEMNLTKFFSAYTLQHQQIWECGMPKANVLEFEPKEFKDRIFYVGDYLSPSMEVSALTGKKTALQISKSLKAQF